ncbi:ABC-three component system protein [Geothrix sp. SG200]|uniref:ABC-three component system protein n=1 Tax=Geothrix sp. SG200 TaxID=2922865 RepID=UPI001FAC6B11|nr:ABC-three component system protein [Geothrix sp. SG200]
MKFAYEDLSPGQFEDLVVSICQFVLGAGVQSFATGPDGGRDAKFIGTAELHPSKAAPWKGTVIVQAKHTNGYNTTFSDSNFYSDTSDETVLGEELPRIKGLRGSKELDHYMLFSNRRLTGNAESKLRGVISKECGLPEVSIFLCGVEQLELWLKRFPDAARMADIDPIDSPLIVSPDDLAEIVEHLAMHLKNAGSAVPYPPTERVSYEKKNELNNMGKEYAIALRRRYLKDTQQIKTFLASPENLRLLDLYESVVDEFQLTILAKRKSHQPFEEVINYLITLLLDRDPILRAQKRLTRTMIFYMYWNCDVGLNHDVES